MITVTEKPVAKGKSNSLVMGLTRGQYHKLIKMQPRGSWWVVFAIKSGGFGMELRADLDEVQKQVAEACV